MTDAHTERFRVWWLSIPLLTAGNQLCMKVLAGEMKGRPFNGAWVAHAILTPWIAAIVVCQIGSFILWLRILSTVKISKALPLTAVSYILIVLFSRYIFDEHLQMAEIGGSALILCGVWLISVE